MNRQEITALLGLMAARDGRAIGEIEVEAWLEDVGAWDFATAREGVRRHYGRTREFMRPADLLGEIKAIRHKRLEDFGPIVPPRHLADDPRAEIEWTRRARERIASGLPVEHAPALTTQARPVGAMVRQVADAKRIPAREGATS